MIGKKGVELAFNSIIIATLGLIALVVILGIFTYWIEHGNLAFWEAGSCKNMGNARGECYSAEERKELSNHHCTTAVRSCEEYCCWPK